MENVTAASVKDGKAKLNFDYPLTTLVEPMHTCMLPELKAMPCFPEDVFVAAFPKTGTTWTRSIVTMILSGRGSQGIDKSVFDIRQDWLYIDIGDFFGEPPIHMAAKRKPPRMVSTHLPFEMLPDSAIQNKCKIIHVYRNPKDVIVSYFKFLKHAALPYVRECHRLDNLEDFAEDFMADRVLYTPFWGNVYSYWLRRNDPNVLFITCEDLHKDTGKEIRRIADLLGKTVTDDVVKDIIDASSFKKMSQNSAVIRAAIASKELDEHGKPVFQFMRKGEVNNWTKHFSPELNAKVDGWIKKNVERYGLQDSGLSY